MPYHDDLTAARSRITALEEEVRRLKTCRGKWHFQPHPDVKACPDCGGANYFRPGAQDKKPGFFRRLFGQADPIIQAGGNITVTTGGGGRIVGLPAEPPPPKLIPRAYPTPPPGGTGVQPPPKDVEAQLAEMRWKQLWLRLEVLESMMERVLLRLGPVKP